MDMRAVQDKPVPGYLELDVGKAMTLRVRCGTVVRCLGGRIWITREGDVRDYVVPANARYCSSEAGLIVISAIDSMSQIAVYRAHPEPVENWVWNGVRFDADFADRLRSAARQEMADYIAVMARCGWGRVLAIWRGVGATTQEGTDVAKPASRRTLLLIIFSPFRGR